MKNQPLKIWYPFSWRYPIVVLLALTLTFSGFSQESPKGQQNLSGLRVDELSDDQLLKFYSQYQEQGFTFEQLELELKNRNLPAIEAEKFVKRLRLLEDQGKIKPALQMKDKEKSTERKSARFSEAPFKSLIPRIFGAELFNNSRLSFEPNLRMATPLNYQVGPDDELLIDIFGYTEQSFELKVSPEGQIRIPNLGPVHVAGLTIDQAQVKIKNHLVRLYPRIASGETSVSVNLGNIRSIKVTLLGEVNTPGTYSLPSLATVFNALYVSGGPSLNGSFRNIKLIRGNKVIARIDMYDFLINGSSAGNLPLKDQDVIKVEPYEHRVEVKGLMKREGYFEILPKDHLQQLLNYAGGFSPTAYSNRIKVIRNTGTQRSVADVERSAFNVFTPRNGDVFIVDSLLNTFENRVEIMGAVKRPGFFALEGTSTLNKLIEGADGFREDAFLSRATLIRKKDDNTLEAISINLNEVVSGSKDLILKKDDRLTVASKTEMREEYTLTIAGEVMHPGNYPYAENMRIEDLIILAGGLKEAASIDNIQVATRMNNIDKKNPSAEIAKVNSFSIRKDLSEDVQKKDPLQPFDVVTIFPQPGYMEQKEVQVNGAVMFPGTYVLSKGNERVSDVIKRAGGITAIGYASGAILVRPRSNSYRDKIMQENKIEALRKLSKDTIATEGEILKEVGKTQDVVGIDLEKILKRPGSKEDLLLEEGDLIEIPALQQTVLVSGQVLYPVRLRYDASAGMRKYISRSGGFSSKALRKRSYVVYANGTARDTRNFLLFRRYPPIKPGSEIVVPLKEERKGVTPIEMVTIASSLTSMVFILSTLMK